MRQVALIILSLLLAGRVGPVAADTAPPEVAGASCEEAHVLEVAQRIQTRYDAIRDLAADFEQTSRSALLAGAALADETPTRGQVIFAKPGRMKWSYVEPEPSLVVSDGVTLWIYDVAAKQASRLPVERGYLAGAALQFLLGDGKLVESFEISAEHCGEDVLELELLPRQPASYERLGLTADVATGEISQTAIVDIFGNYTRIRFENLRVDLAPSADVFRFEAPPGVDVIDLSPTQ